MPGSRQLTFILTCDLDQKLDCYIMQGWKGMARAFTLAYLANETFTRYIAWLSVEICGYFYSVKVDCF